MKNDEAVNEALHRIEKDERLCRMTCLRVCNKFFEFYNRTTDADDDNYDEDAQQLRIDQARKLCYKLEAEHDSRRDPICLTVRSVPVPVYGNILRHFYVRVEDVLDVHPGTRHRLALAWWHNSTALDTDVRERELRLCGDCCDEFLDHVWRGSERFNIIWNNCDQMLNRCEQSFVLGLLVLQILWYPLFQDIVGFLLSVLALLVFFLLRVYANVQSPRERRCDRRYYCRHVQAAEPS